MLDDFSSRARQVVFLARFQAGERGAAAIEVEDLIQALILEDQGMVESVLAKIYGGAGTAINQNPPHVSFFSSEIAKELLRNLEGNLEQSQAAPLAAEILLSRSLEAIFNSAKALQTRFQHREIEPLHLLAAIVSEGKSPGVQLLQKLGVTDETVVAALSRAARG